MTRNDDDPGPLITQRAALILMMATLIGLIAGGLTFWAQRSTPESILAGGAALGGAIALLHEIIG